MSHAPRAFHVVSNKDGSNAHVATLDASGKAERPLCGPVFVGDKPVRLGRNVSPAPVGCYEDVATTTVDICDGCREMASSIAATERAFEMRDRLEQALANLDTVTLAPADLQVVLAALAPWAAKGMGVRPDGAPLTGE